LASWTLYASRLSKEMLLDGALLRTFRERVPAWVPDAEDGALESVHHPFLLIEVGLVRQVVERQDGRIPREYSPDERRAIEVVAARSSHPPAIGAEGRPLA